MIRRLRVRFLPLHPEVKDLPARNDVFLKSRMSYSVIKVKTMRLKIIGQLGRRAWVISPSIRWCGEIGKREGLKNLCRKTCGFNSHHQHQRSTVWWFHSTWTGNCSSEVRINCVEITISRLSSAGRAHGLHPWGHRFKSYSLDQEIWML